MWNVIIKGAVSEVYKFIIFGHGTHSNLKRFNERKMMDHIAFIYVMIYFLK